MLIRSCQEQEQNICCIFHWAALSHVASSIKALLFIRMSEEQVFEFITHFSSRCVNGTMPTRLQSIHLQSTRQLAIIWSYYMVIFDMVSYQLPGRMPPNVL